IFYTGRNEGIHVRPNPAPLRCLQIAVFMFTIAMTHGAEAASPPPAPAANPPDANLLRAECEYGIALALAGADASAESAFVSLLSHAPGDARALNNLGNTHLLRGASHVAIRRGTRGRRHRRFRGRLLEAIGIPERHGTLGLPDAAHSAIFQRRHCPWSLGASLGRIRCGPLPAVRSAPARLALSLAWR